MKAVVMAGGEGTRLRPLSSQSPKPMVPVVGTPVIEHNLRLLRDHGITEVVVTLHHLGADIRNRLGDGSELDMAIDYVVEERPLGTAGSVRNAAHLLDDTFLIMSGDCLTDIDLSHVIAQHRAWGALATIVLTSVPNPLEYGVVITGSDARVERFLEKPSWGEVFSDHVNTGMYVVEPQLLDEDRPGHQRRLVPGRLPRHARPRRAALRLRRRGLLVRHRQHPVVPPGQLGRPRRSGALPHPGHREGDVWLGDDVEMGLGAVIEGPRLPRRRGQAQGGHPPHRPGHRRPLLGHRRERPGHQLGDLAAHLHRRGAARFVRRWSVVASP